MADLQYSIHGHLSHPDGSDQVLGESEDDRVDDYELKQEADISAHILDQPYDDNPDDVTGLPPVLKNNDHVYSMAYLVNMDLAPLGSLKDIEVSRHLHPQHKVHHNDFGKVSIASITGSPDSIGSDKANISSLVNDDDVGVEDVMAPSAAEIGSVAGAAPNGPSIAPASLPPGMGPNDTTTINGIVYNSRGYEVCGQLNQHSKPCQRIGRCPFHGGKKPDGVLSGSGSIMLPQPIPATLPLPTIPEAQVNTVPSPPQPQVPQVQQLPQPPTLNHSVEMERAPVLQPAAPPMKKAPYKQGWTKDEHVRFLNGLQIHGKGAWKEIAQIVGSRTPTQIQSHAQKYYLRQKQEVKNKRSIHDLSLDDIAEADSNQAGAATRAPVAQATSFSPMATPANPQNPQDPVSGPLGMLFSSFYRAPGNTNNANSATDASTSINSAVSSLVGQSFTHPSNFRTQPPPPPMAQPVFTNSVMHSGTLLPHINSSHHNSLPPLPSSTMSHAPAAPFPTSLYTNWFSSTFSAPAGSKMLSLPEFGIDDDVTVGDGLGIEDLHQSPTSNSVRSLISINDDDHPPLTHHLPHPPYPHDDDDKMNQFSSSYMSIPTIPRIDEDSNELPPLTGSRKRHFIDDDKPLHDGLHKQFKSSPPHQQVSLPLYLNHSP